MMRPVLVAVPPVMPKDVSFNGNTLSWTDNSLSETAFVVEKFAAGGTQWTPINTITRALTDPNTTGQSLSFADASWADGDSYRVFAQNTIGDTATAGFPTVTVNSAYAYVGAATPTAAPTNLAASLQAGPQINLTWKDNSSNETGFAIERSVNGGAFSLLSTVASNTVSYIDSTVSTGSTYAYRVAATNLMGLTAYTNTVSINVPLNAPSNLTATLQSGPKINLAWTDNSSNESGFTLQRSVNGGAFLTLANLGPNVTSYVDSALTIGNTYTYQVAATNQYGSSAYSNTASVPVPTVPVAPSNLTASLQAGPQANLTFTDNATNETGFVLERSVNGGAYAPLTTLSQLLGTGIVSYTDITISAGNSYRYRVAAVNMSGVSAYATSGNVSVPAMPNAPGSFTATNGANQGTSRRVNLTWTDLSNNETGFRIERSTDNITWALVTTTGANATSYTVTGLTRNTNYYFRIRANNGNIIFSVWVTASPFPIHTNP
jgi:titin